MPMKIHHTVIKRAEKLGFLLEADGDEAVATLPRRGVKIRAPSATDAIETMDRFIQIDKINDEYRLFDGDYTKGYRLIDSKDGRLLDERYLSMRDLIDVVNNYEDGTGPMAPEGIDPDPETEIETVSTEDLPIDIEAPIPDAEIERSTKTFYKPEGGKKIGVPLDGAIAYAEGVVMGDNPWDQDEEADEFLAWETAWDEAADAATTEDDEKSGSVVSDKYRLKYKELGHPTHCGDWLADTLNGLVLNKGGTNLELFEAICNLNGVDTSKYKRDGVGWQGRLRMTGRNLLAKAVYMAGGELKVMQGDTIEVIKAPKDWMTAQRFKMPKAVQAAPTPEAKK